MSSASMSDRDARCKPASPSGASERRLTHVSRGGRPRMVDVSDKPATARRAVAEAFVDARAGDDEPRSSTARSTKGDVLTVAEMAGVMGGKRTSELIPLCHPIPLTDLVVEITPDRVGGRPAHPGDGGHGRADGRRDGGADRGDRRGADRLRHGQGRRPQRGHPRRAAAREDRAASPGSGTGRPDAAGARPRGRAPKRVSKPRSCRRRARRDDAARAGPDHQRRRRRGDARRRERRAPSPSGSTRARLRASSATSWPTSMESIAMARHRRRSDDACALVVSTGGTGLGPRDRTPQTLHGLLDYEIPGFGEQMRAYGRTKTPMADLSRSTGRRPGHDPGDRRARQPERRARLTRRRSSRCSSTHSRRSAVTRTRLGRAVRRRATRN